MTEYIEIHDADYAMTYPISKILEVLTSLDFVMTQNSTQISHSSGRCGAVVAHADKNGSYGHYHLPNNVNLLELIVWDYDDFEYCAGLANSIAEALKFKVYHDSK